MADVVIRALVVTNMWPSSTHPARGSFVADQVRALRASGEAEVEVHAFDPSRGGARAYARAARTIRRRFGDGPRFDVVHAHFGLTGWPARVAPATVHAVTLHGTDVVHPRSRAITLAGLPLDDLVATVSTPLAERVPRWATRGRAPAILPAGVALERFAPVDRTDGRRALGLDPDGRYLLFPADPARPEKRFDRARALAQATGHSLLSLGAVDPARVPLWVNAADAVLVTSERESFGLAALEALACEVPVLSTPVGVAPQVLRDLPGTLCAPWEPTAWRAFLDAHAGERLDGGRARARPYSATAMAARVLDAWRAALAAGG